jgi:pyruvate formate lyase activating enzyme
MSYPLRECHLCRKEFDYISNTLPFCRKCILKEFGNLEPVIRKIHNETREKFNLPGFPPEKGLKCGLCKRYCRIGKGEYGFCGLRKTVSRKIVHTGGTKDKGFLKYYYDPLPTNCVADWMCSGHTKSGYYNLAVFYESCSLNCLFCQNYHFRYLKPEEEVSLTSEELLRAIHPAVHCVCFFGGDPTTQALHSLEVAKEAVKRGMVVCYESNGLWNDKILEQIIDVVRKSGGYLKFDIKAWNREIYFSLTGYDGKGVLENFKKCAEMLNKDAKKHLCVSTLMVPGYVNEEEVYEIARFIARFDPEIPYALLAFAPNFEMKDVRTTKYVEAEKCMKVAKEAGLKNVRIGNSFLLR